MYSTAPWYMTELSYKRMAFKKGRKGPKSRFNRFNHNHDSGFSRLNANPGNVTCRLSFGFYSIVTPFSSFPSAFSAPLHPMLLYNIITRRVREGRGEEKQSTLSLSRSLGHRVDYIYISTQPDVKFNGSWRLYRLCVFQNIPCQEENEPLSLWIVIRSDEI